MQMYRCFSFLCCLQPPSSRPRLRDWRSDLAAERRPNQKGGLQLLLSNAINLLEEGGEGSSDLAVELENLNADIRVVC